MINEDLYRKCLEAVAAAEVRRMRKVCGTQGHFMSQEEAASRGAMGGAPRRTVFFDPQDHRDFADG